MKGIFRQLLFPAAFLCFLTMGIFSAFAANKINSVSVKFSVDGYSEEGYPQIEAYTSAKHYFVSDVTLETDSDTDDVSSIDYANARYCLDLSADDGYAFYITKASQVKLSGYGAAYVKATRLNSGTTLHIVFKFEELSEFCGDISQADWDANGRLSWTPAQNALRYKISVYRDEHAVGSGIYTGAVSYDCRPLMLDAGQYTAKITPETSEEKGSALRTETFNVTEAMADANKALYGLQIETVVTGESGGPDSVSQIVLNAGWKHDGTGWWYQDEDGSYIQYNWLQSGNDWYFFDSDGYMVTDTVISWGKSSYYFGNEGKLVKDAVIPDGRKAGSDGSLSGKITKVADLTTLGTEEASPIGPGISAQ